MADGRCEAAQSMVGNMVAQNTADAAMVQLALCAYTVQSDGGTAWEKAQSRIGARHTRTASVDPMRSGEHAQQSGASFEQWCKRRVRWFTAEAQVRPAEDPKSSGRKRANEEIAPEEDELNLQFRDEIRVHGKDKKTKRQYSGGEAHWRMCMDQKDWDPYLTNLSYEEVADRATYFMAHEARKYKLDIGSLRSKMSAVRWMHVRDRKPDPLAGNDIVSDWLRDYGKHCSPPEPKVGVPVQMLQYVALHLDLDGLDLNGCVIDAAAKSGFWWLMRSIEYLANDEGHFDPDRSVTYDDMILRCKGEVIPRSRMPDADEITLTLYSGKGSLHTCTRTLHRKSANPACPIVALIRVYKAFIKHFEKPPTGKDSPFTLTSGKVLNRMQLADIQKKAAVSCGVPGSRVATHSLRRGGASCYALSISGGANLTELDIQPFGRWTSDGYKKYITSHTNMMQSGNANPALVVPRFERN